MSKRIKNITHKYRIIATGQYNRKNPEWLKKVLPIAKERVKKGSRWVGRHTMDTGLQDYSWHELVNHLIENYEGHSIEEIKAWKHRRG